MPFGKPSRRDLLPQCSAHQPTEGGAAGLQSRIKSNRAMEVGFRSMTGWGYGSNSFRTTQGMKSIAQSAAEMTTKGRTLSASRPFTTGWGRIQWLRPVKDTIAVRGTKNRATTPREARTTLVVRRVATRRSTSKETGRLSVRLSRKDHAITRMLSTTG